MRKSMLVVSALALLASSGMAVAQPLGGIGGAVGGAAGGAVGGTVGGPISSSVGGTVGGDVTGDVRPGDTRASPSVGANSDGAVNTGGSAMGGAANAAAGAGANASASEGEASADTRAAGRLAIGISVRDSSGMAVGRVVALGANAQGQAQAVIQMGSRKVTVPASSLTVNGNVAVSNQTRAQLRGAR